jgi:hypothetical protein
MSNQKQLRSRSVEINDEPTTPLNSEHVIDITFPSMHGQPSPIYDTEPHIDMTAGYQAGEDLASRRGETAAGERQTTNAAATFQSETNSLIQHPLQRIIDLIQASNEALEKSKR